MLSQYKFSEIFQENPDKSLSLCKTVKIYGITFEPGTVFGPTDWFGDIDFYEYRHLDIAAEEENGILVLKGFFKE